MKKKIHPNYNQRKFVCSCGAEYEIGTAFAQTLKNENEVHVSVCSNCHKFYTGDGSKAKAEGRAVQFNKKWGLES